MINKTIENPKGADYKSVLSAKVADEDLKDTHTLMLHFDTIFDLRAAALCLISKEYMLMSCVDGSYYKRAYDVFGDQELGIINKTKIDAIINECAQEIADSAKLSRAIELTMDYVCEYIDKSKMSPHAQHVRILLNFGHYPFSDEKKLEAFDQYNKTFEPMGVQVNACDYTIAQLNQNNLSDVDSLFIYDWMTWMQYHENTIEQYKIKTKIHAPRVVPLPNGNIDEIEQAKKILKDLRMTPYDFIRKGVSRYLTFSFIDICYYCVLDEFNNIITERGHLKPAQKPAVQ